MQSYLVEEGDKDVYHEEVSSLDLEFSIETCNIILPRNQVFVVV